MSIWKRMTRIDQTIIEKTIVTLLLCGWYVEGQQVGYHQGDMSPLLHLQAMVSHANIWHLAGNLFVIYLLRRLYIVPAVLLAFVASYIPTVGTLWDLLGCCDAAIDGTMGFSGAIFAMLGIMWGRHFVEYAGKDRFYGCCVIEAFCKNMLPWALIGFFIPHICWELHFYSLVLGVIWGVVWQNSKT